MKITGVRAVPLSDVIPEGRRHRTDLGTKVKSDSVLVYVDTDEGLTGLGAPRRTTVVRARSRPPATGPVPSRCARRRKRGTMLAAVGSGDTAER